MHGKRNNKKRVFFPPVGSNILFDGHTLSLSWPKCFWAQDISFNARILIVLKDIYIKSQSLNDVEWHWLSFIQMRPKLWAPSDKKKNVHFYLFSVHLTRASAENNSINSATKHSLSISFEKLKWILWFARFSLICYICFCSPLCFCCCVCMSERRYQLEYLEVKKKCCALYCSDFRYRKNHIPECCYQLVRSTKSTCYVRVCVFVNACARTSLQYERVVVCSEIHTHTQSKCSIYVHTFKGSWCW